MKVKLGIKISGVHDRDFFIAQELKKMNLHKERENVVQYNGKTKDIVSCFMKALSCFEDDEEVTHAVILQDDLQLCDNFLEIITKCCEQFPEAMWTMFCSRISDEDKKKDTPYILIKGCGFYGPCVVFPRKFIKDFKEWVAKNVPEGFPHDDAILGEYAKQKGLKVMSTIPSLLQHLGGRTSMLGHNFNVVSKVWKGEQAPMNENWNNDLYNHSKYIGTGFDGYLKTFLRGKNENN